MFKDRKPLVSESKNLKAKYAKIKAYRNRAKKMAQTFYLVQFSVTQFSSVFKQDIVSFILITFYRLWEIMTTLFLEFSKDQTVHLCL